MEQAIFFHTTSSTNDVAKRYAAAGCPHGLLVCATSQTKGRGRLGRQWHSRARGGLYFSLVVRPKIATVDYPKMTLVAGLAVAKVLSRYTSEPVGLKWPNDVHIRQRKCCGILTEASPLGFGQTTPYAVIGIGINLNFGPEGVPLEIRDKAIALSMFAPGELRADVLAGEIRASLLALIQQAEKDGFRRLLSQWRQRDCLLGRQTRWLAANGTLVVGIALGIDDEGQMLVQTEDGNIHEVLTGDLDYQPR